MSSEVSFTEGRFRTKHRRGTATAELALCLPLMVMLVFACIEACSMIFVKQSLSIAAYEGSRAALVPGATSVGVEDASNEILASRRVQGATVTIQPSDIETAVAGDYLTVTVEAPCDQNSWFHGFFFKHSKLRGQTTMMKEF